MRIRVSWILRRRGENERLVAVKIAPAAVIGGLAPGGAALVDHDLLHAEAFFLAPGELTQAIEAGFVLAGAAIAVARLAHAIPANATVVEPGIGGIAPNARTLFGVDALACVAILRSIHVADFGFIGFIPGGIALHMQIRAPRAVFGAGFHDLAAVDLGAELVRAPTACGKHHKHHQETRNKQLIIFHDDLLLERHTVARPYGFMLRVMCYVIQGFVKVCL